MAAAAESLVADTPLNETERAELVRLRRKVTDRARQFEERERDVVFLKSLGVLCRDATEVTYLFIESECADTDGDGTAKSVMFRNLPKSSSGFYAWRKRATGREPFAGTRRRADLLAKIASIHRDSAGRVTADHRGAARSRRAGDGEDRRRYHGCSRLAGISPRSFKVSTRRAGSRLFGHGHRNPGHQCSGDDFPRRPRQSIHQRRRHGQMSGSGLRQSVGRTGVCWNNACSKRSGPCSNMNTIIAMFRDKSGVAWRLTAG